MILKCKICGGSLSVSENQKICECEYCGTKQTLPKLDNERILNLYDRASHLRRNNEFDKASIIYEQILSEDKNDAEAYWSLVLCKYGVEYVEDPNTHQRIPTVNRTQYNSIYNDSNYKEAIKLASVDQRILYEEEAKKIDDIQRNILYISEKEEPYDIFICYKETDKDGRRTIDSVLAQDIYNELTKEGYKVFFSRISLEDKIGSAYEPYIFAALNSAKAMIVVGTKTEHFNAVWVKNEWSRYLHLINSGERKILIPAYKDMDPYDLPEEFAHLQAQDLSKLGFMQDLIRGINKIIGRSNNYITNNTNITNINSHKENVDALLKRAYIFIEDNDIESAEKYLDIVLDIEPENANAYLGKLLLDKNVRNFDELIEYYSLLYSEERKQDLYMKDIADELDKHKKEMCEKYSIKGYLNNYDITSRYRFYIYCPSCLQNRIEQKEMIQNELEGDNNVSKIMKYGSEKLKKQITSIIDAYDQRINQAKTEYDNNISQKTKELNELFEREDQRVIREYEIASEKREKDYQKAIEDYNRAETDQEFLKAYLKFKEIENYKDSKDYIAKIQTIREKNRNDKLQKEFDQIRKNDKLRRTILIALIVVIAIIALIWLFNKFLQIV